MAISSAGVAGLKPGVVDNAAARPSSPFEGQLVYEKDVDMLAIWNGTEWGYIYSSSGNLLINGAMQVTQRSGVGTAVTGITSSAYYTADRFYTGLATLGTWTQTTIADAPTGSGFRNSLKMACTTADASPAAGDYCIVRQKIEGQNLQQFAKGTANAKPFTLSFWVKSFQTGTFICELEDSDNLRSVSASYTVLASNTWEYKTILFPADATGVLDNDANTSFIIYWWLGAGSTYSSGTLNTTWGTQVNANRAVGQTNVASATTGEWYITGVQLEANYQATPFEHRPIGVELALCQRYFYQMNAAGTYNYYAAGGGGSANGGNVQINMPVPFRAQAHTLLTSNVTLSDYAVNVTSGTLTISTALSNFNTTSILFTSAGAYTVYRSYVLLANNTLTSSVSVSAEL